MKTNYMRNIFFIFLFVLQTTVSVAQTHQGNNGEFAKAFCDAMNVGDYDLAIRYFSSDARIFNFFQYPYLTVNDIDNLNNYSYVTTFFEDIRNRAQQPRVVYSGFSSVDSEHFVLWQDGVTLNCVLFFTDTLINLIKPIIIDSAICDRYIEIQKNLYIDTIKNMYNTLCSFRYFKTDPTKLERNSNYDSIMYNNELLRQLQNYQCADLTFLGRKEVDFDTININNIGNPRCRSIAYKLKYYQPHYQLQINGNFSLYIDECQSVVQYRFSIDRDKINLHFAERTSETNPTGFILNQLNITQVYGNRRQED